MEKLTDVSKINGQELNFCEKLKTIHSFLALKQTIELFNNSFFKNRSLGDQKSDVRNGFPFKLMNKLSCSLQLLYYYHDEYTCISILLCQTVLPVPLE